MIINKQKIFRFLFSIVPKRIYNGVYLCSSKNIGVLFFPPPKKILEKDVIWITPFRWVFRKYQKSSYMVYFLQKQRDGYVICDKRYLKTEYGRYLLPAVAASLTKAKKTVQMQKLEQEYFAFPKRGTFYLEGDSLFRLQEAKYTQALERRKKIFLPKTKLTEQLFLFCLSKLDG